MGELVLAAEEKLGEMLDDFMSVKELSITLSVDERTINYWTENGNAASLNQIYGDSLIQILYLDQNAKNKGLKPRATFN